MASDKTEMEANKRELKHLTFLEIASVRTFVFISNLYDYAKQNSGPLRSTAITIEGAVTKVASPVYEKFKGVPYVLLTFLDEKVDVATHKFDEHAPPIAKKIVSQARNLFQKASQKAEKFVDDARSGGPRSAVCYAATEYKEFVLTISAKLWVGLNQYPPVHAVAEMAVPTAAHWSAKYNDTVKNLTQKGYTIFGYLPLVPIDEIAKTFKQGKTAKKVDTAADEDKSD